MASGQGTTERTASAVLFHLRWSVARAPRRPLNGITLSGRARHVRTSGMNTDVTLNIRLADQSEGRYVLAVAVRNESPRRILIPWPEIIGFRFRAVGGSEEADWLTSTLQHSRWGGGVLQPGEAREF